MVELISEKSLDCLLNPRSIAIVGVRGGAFDPSARNSMARRFVENLLHHGYKGHIYPINPRYEKVGDLVCYPSISAVPWHVDAKALMPYIKNPQQASIRKWNFNQIAPNLQPNGTVNGPCVMAGGASCSQIPVNKKVCQDNGGVWWGEGAQDSDADGPGPVPETYCCNVNIYLTYLPTRANESTIKIINIPKNEYNINSSLTLLVLSPCCSSKR